MPKDVQAPTHEDTVVSRPPVATNDTAQNTDATEVPVGSAMNHLRRSWKTFAAQPVTVVALYVMYVVASVVLAFLGSVFRLESLLSALQRPNLQDATLGRIVLPPKARQAYGRGLWRMLLSVLRTDVTAAALVLVVTAFAAAPALLAYPISASLQVALLGTTPFWTQGLALLPVATLGLLAIGAVSMVWLTHVRLLSHAQESDLNSTVHVRVLGMALSTCRRHGTFVLGTVLLSAGLVLLLAGVFLGLEALTSRLLPVSHVFLLTSLGLPAALGLLGYLALVHCSAAERLASHVGRGRVQQATRDSISLTARFGLFLLRVWRAISGPEQSRWLAASGAVAALGWFVVAFWVGANLLSYAFVIVFATLMASVTVLAVVHGKKGAQS